MAHTWFTELGFAILAQSPFFGNSSPMMLLFSLQHSTYQLESNILDLSQFKLPFTWVDS